MCTNKSIGNQSGCNRRICQPKYSSDVIQYRYHTVHSWCDRIP